MTKPIHFQIEQSLTEQNAGIEFLAERIQVNKPDLLSVVSIVVPNGQARVDIGLALTHTSPQIGLNYLMLRNLTDALALSLLIKEGKTLANTEIMLAVINSLNTDKPSLLENFYSNSELLPNTEIALIETFKQLDWLKDEQVLKQLPNNLGELYLAFKAELNESSYITESDLYQLYIRNLKDNNKKLEHQFEQTEAVILYLCSPLRQKEMEFLNELSNHTKVEIITNSALTEGIEDDFKDLLNLSNLKLTKGEPPKVPGGGRNKEITYRKFFDPIREVKTVVCEVFETLKTSQCAPSQLAILFTTPQPYRYLLHNELLISDIKFVGPTLKNLSQSIAGQALLALLDIAQNGFTSSEVIKLLEYNPKLAGEYKWKTQIRQASIPDKTDNWEKQLRDLDILDVLNPIFKELKKLGDNNKKDNEKNASWMEKTKILSKLLDKNLDLEDSTSHQKEALSQIQNTLQNLTNIDNIKSCLPNIETLNKILSYSLSSQPFWRQNRAGRGVLVGSISNASHILVDHIWVLGLAEGFFPASSLREKIVSNSDWHNLAKRDTSFFQNTSEFQIAKSLKNLNAAKLAGRKSVHFSYPTSDISKTSELSGMPTRWIEDKCIEKPAPPIPITAQTINLNNLSNDSNNLKSDIYIGGLEMLKARQSTKFTRFDGLVKNFNFSRKTSPTALEEYVKCPQAYFFKNILDLEMDQYETGYDLPKNIDIGNIYHRILATYNKCIASKDTTEKDSTVLENTVTKIYEDFFNKKSEKLNYLQKELIAETISTLTKLLNFMNQRKEVWENIGNELTEKIELKFSNKTYKLETRIDLIESTTIGNTPILQALDYKTGKSENYKKLLNGHVGGKYLQYFIYTKILQNKYPDAEIRSGYIFVNGKDLKFKNTNLIILSFKEDWFRSGEKEIFKYKEIESILEEILRNIEAGFFPQGIYETITGDRKLETTKASGIHHCKWCDPYNTSYTRLDNQSPLQILNKTHKNIPLTKYLFPYSLKISTK